MRVSVEVAVPLAGTATPMGFRDAVGQFGPGHVPVGPAMTVVLSDRWPTKLFSLMKTIVELALPPLCVVKKYGFGETK